MSSENWSPRPYTDQELLSFDRLKRAVMSRVLDRAEAMMDIEFPLGSEKTTEITKDEWLRAKEAVKNSPNAREAYRRYLEGTVGEQIDSFIRADKTELSSMGVVEKTI